MWNLSELYLLKIWRPHEFKRYIDCLNSIAFFEFPACKCHMQKYRENHHGQNCVADALYLKYYIWLNWILVPLPPSEDFCDQYLSISGIKMVIRRVLFKVHGFKGQRSALRRPTRESGGKERLRDLTFLQSSPALGATQMLAELQLHTDTRTRPFKDRLIFLPQWLHSCRANQQTWWYASRTPAYTFKSLHTVQRHAGSQRASAQNINMIFSQSSVKPCQMYRA